MTPEEQLEYSREWVAHHQEAYRFILLRVRFNAMAYPDRTQRVERYVEDARERGHSIPNAVRAYLAREIASELESEGVEVKMSMGKSKIDEVVE